LGAWAREKKSFHYLEPKKRRRTIPIEPLQKQKTRKERSGDEVILLTKAGRDRKEEENKNRQKLGNEERGKGEADKPPC